MENNEIEKITSIATDFFVKMGILVTQIEVAASPAVDERGGHSDLEVVDMQITTEDPQFLIGQNGQTLLELQRLLKILLHKKLQKNFYLNVDINGYKRKKLLYLKNLAKNVADEVLQTKVKKILPPMSSYERRIVHAELATRPDVITESQGEGPERSVVISPVI